MMSTTAMPTAPPPAPEAPALSEPQRIINVFVAPSTTFNDIRRNASWWAPFVLLAIMAYAMVGVVSAKVGFEQVTENGLKMRPKQAQQLESLPPGEHDRRLAVMTSVTKGISYAFPIVQLIVLAIIALLMLATMNFGAGAQTKFGQCMAVTVYASLPGIIKSLLAILLLCLGVGVESFTFQNPIASNASVFATVGTPLYALLSAFDVFNIWVLLVAGIGFSTISGLKRSTTWAMVFGWYAFSTLLSVGAADLFT